MRPSRKTETSYGEMSTPFERDMDDQAEALRAFAQSALSPALTRLLHSRYERIVLTGMGSSHFAALPGWRRLADAGHPVWLVDSGQLLDAPGLVTPGTLLVVTSQSGASAEIVAMAEPRGPIARATALIAVTNDLESPLARCADDVIGLHSGDEATVSTKSYLNSLAAHERFTSVINGTPADDTGETVKAIEEFNRPAVLRDLAADFVATPDARLVYIGFGDRAASALYAGLITKEAAKVAAEGYIGGQFRHGPLELAGPGLTAVLFGGDGRAHGSVRQLGADLLDSGSNVLTVGAPDLVGAINIGEPGGSMSARLAHDALIAQHFTVAIATARGITPGVFTYGSKVTTAL
jgi:glucosamine--fructose-6-phosphate aminotransferase (isomerizing)